ncbi:sugar phosphate isomerase/epimerase [Saprospiraceae bacterium]|nr:sugar phosphate isomerase/epimerase [Saprospiraceae bacterium]
MKTIKGPAIFLAQFMGEEAPFNSLENICKWVADLGYKGIQIPTWDTRLIDLDKAHNSKDYCDELKGKVASFGLEITELSTHLQGQLVAVHPAFDEGFDVFAPENVRKNPKARQAWAVDQVKKAGSASMHLGIKAHPTFSGAFIWQNAYPWPQRPNGLVDEAFTELANRWRPILDHFDSCGVDVAYEIHPGEDLHDGVTFERFLAKVDNHPRCNMLYDPSHYVLQQLDYLTFIDHYHEKIKAFHVKDAEFNPNGKSGIYGGYQDWVDRPGRFRSLGDGQVDFKSIFTKLSQYGFDGWAVMEWECCIKSPDQGAKEGAPFIKDHIIEVTEKAFDDFAGEEVDKDTLRRLMGL